ncbi:MULTISPECIES: sulfatase family protein [Gordonia]|uniref:Sulfatase n=1 Tax=Gordonia amicalis TaxID=89053 RepID=A0AAE4U753_9ACTN|nr:MULTISPECIES: sulfatase [Gordonia]ATD70137.1 sulfatase [Gordonia sp. 1D]MBA5849240.1 sulfatase [Gordonia amicalis]MCR8896945.1 sulfatase [Gordonia sp. GONU]MCZ4578241.1 sulfatase [Gordonia amicalis]MDJ0455211.1 sulfatase [Gordonia amicalis]
MARENVILIHWHDLGRHLTCYGADGVSSPALDQLAAHGIRFADAHSTAPLCSPARGSLFTGRYPHRNGLVGLAHHGFEYHADVRTLPSLLADAGYRSVLFGMQHESADPQRLGFDSVDVSDSRCDHVVEQSQDWLRRHADEDRPFFLTAGFFETHRPYPADEYEPSDTSGIAVPGFLPDTDDVREDLAGLHGSITKADAAVGRLLDTVAELGLDSSTWIVFITDHGLAFPRAKSTLYAAGTGVALIMRPPTQRGIEPQVYDDLFSGVDLTPTLLELLGVEIPDEVDGDSHASALVGPLGEPAAAVRTEVFTEKTYHDAFDPIRAVRTKEHSYIENFATRPALLLPLDIADSLSARSLDIEAIQQDRPRVELYDLRSDPHERNNVAEDPAYAEVRAALAATLSAWRAETGDDLPDEATGTAIAQRFMGALNAKAPRVESQEDALPSRRPRGSRR